MESILLAIAAGAVGLVAAGLLAMRVLKQPQGNDEVRAIGDLIREGSAAFIAAEVWHTVANTGDDDLIMVFAFTSSDYPPTDHKPSRLIDDNG
jgi:Na+/H+-translocating membrane pyrophosphatase